MAQSFDDILKFVLGWETAWGKHVYSNDPTDPGGETKFGISKRAHPDVDIANLTEEGAAEIYQREYWSADGIQKSMCANLPWPVNLVHFDAVVNAGNWDAKRGWHGTANKMLQRALGVSDDGLIGAATLAAVGGSAPLLTACSAIIQRQKFYRRIIKDKPPMAKYMDGWFNRVEDLLVHALR